MFYAITGVLTYSKMFFDSLPIVMGLRGKVLVAGAYRGGF